MSTCADTTFLSDLFRRQPATVQAYGRYIDPSEDLVATFLNRSKRAEAMIEEIDVAVRKAGTRAMISVPRGRRRAPTPG